MAIGPGSVQAVATNVKPMLEGASEFEFITIHNPLTEDFVGRVGMDVPVNMPYQAQDQDGIVLGEAEMAKTYGVGLRNRDFTGRKHIVNDITIKAGGTVNLKGNEAQVIVKQLVDAIIQLEGRTKMMPDPEVRKAVEEKVILRRGNVQELMDTNYITPSQQATAAVNKSNEVNNEEALTAGVGQAVSGQDAGTADLTNSDQASPRPVGRPKKTDS